MKTYRRRTILRLQNMFRGLCDHDVKVTRLGDGYNIRVFMDGELNQESRVYDRSHVSPEIQDMLRMEDKCGNISKMAGSSRDRATTKSNKASRIDSA